MAYQGCGVSYQVTLKSGIPFEEKTMQTSIYPDKVEMARAAAAKAAEFLREGISSRGHATFIAATGVSQYEFLDNLAVAPSIDWSKTTMFHLDEYIGLLEMHPASFRLYLNKRIVDRVHPGVVNLIQGNTPDPLEECARLGKLIRENVVDVAFVGIGENGHLAFNDPPADFITEEAYIVVELDQACRRQQLGEGWFKSLDEVPHRAISMSIRQIMKARAIICVVPDQRKAVAVRDCFTREISPLYPASILRNHDQAYVYLDNQAASLLTG
jgi:glucosamine-6-phosphate deaminase